MSRKRAVFTGAMGALTLATAGSLWMAIPSVARNSPAHPTAASAAAPAALPAAAAKLPKVPYLPMKLAQRAATSALAACHTKGFAVTTTVVNADGIIIVLLRNDGANAASVRSSTGKALASAGFRTASDVLGTNAAKNPGLLTVPDFILLGGGLPISSGGNVVAGIGVGGAPSGEIDKTCAQSGLKSIAGSL